jgi:hypothetical protein
LGKVEKNVEENGRGTKLFAADLRELAVNACAVYSVKKLLTAEVAEEKPQRPLRKASSEKLD